MTTVTLEGTNELMKHRDVAVILATGGMGLVRAAYSAGKPAYGVGPGNAPAYIERTANVKKAVQRHHHRQDVRQRRPLLVRELRRRGRADRRRREARVPGAGRLLHERAPRWMRSRACSSRRSGCRIRRSSARRATFIAEKCGINVPADTRVLIAPLEGVGRDYPLSIEKLCPVLSFYVVSDWREGCERCKQILRYGGMGHTMSIHSQNDQVILEFGLKKPAFRICVNTPTTLGSIGLTTGLDPAMTLGCGGYGGNITSDNISPRHLLNIKRLAYEITPAVSLATRRSARSDDTGSRRRPTKPAGISARCALPPDRRVPGVSRVSWRRAGATRRLTAVPARTTAAGQSPTAAEATPEPAGTPGAARFRVRGGRAAGDSGRSKTARFRARHRHPVRSRSRRRAPGVHARPLAELGVQTAADLEYAFVPLIAESVGLIVDPPGSSL